MSFFSRRHFFVLVAAAVAVAAGYLLSAPKEISVATMVVTPAPAKRVLAVNGRVRPRLQVDVRAPVSGELIELPFDVGDTVEKGQTLARLDDAPETAAIAVAEAAVQVQMVTLAQAKRDLERYVALGEFSSRRDLEQRRMTVDEGVKELARRQATALQASETRDRRVLKSPFQGAILERLVDQGQTVSPDAIIYRLADLARPQISAEVDEIYASEIMPGMSVLVSFSPTQNNVLGTVLHIEPRVDPATGARDVRIELPENIGSAPAGFTVALNFIVEDREVAISIPRRAITDAAVNPRVLVVSSDNVVLEREITFVDWPAPNVIVTSGLKSGDRVVLDAAAAKPGERLKTE